MPFGVDTSGIPSIPGLSDVVSTPSSGLAGSTKDLMTSLVDSRSSLFANPMTNAIGSTSSSIESLQSQLTSIADGSLINPLISAGDATTFLGGSSILDVQTGLGNLLSHTDRLSGVLKGAGVSTPGLEEILSIGKQMNDYVNLLNAGSGCLSMLGGCTGLFSQNDLAAQTAPLITLLDNIARNIATIADIIETLSNLKQFVDGIISKDSQFLQNCLNQLQSAALAMGLEYVFQDPCAKFLLESVANRNPGGILNKLVH